MPDRKHLLRRRTLLLYERQKVTVDLTKTLEQDEIFGIGSAGEIQNVAFGLMLQRS